jgi:hypothetical protein
VIGVIVETGSGKVGHVDDHLHDEGPELELHDITVMQIIIVACTKFMPKTTWSPW